MSLKSSIAAIATAALAVTAIIVTPSLASAAPGDIGTDQWVATAGQDSIAYWAALDGSQAESDLWLDSLTGTATTSCIDPSDPRVISGMAEHPSGTGDGGVRPIVTLVAPAFESASDYDAASGVFTLDFMASPCASAWGLDGSWWLPEGGALFPPGGGFEARVDTDNPASGTDGVITTPGDYLRLSDGSLAASGTGFAYLGRGDGTYVWASFGASVGVVSITPTPASLTASVGEELTLDLAAVLGTFTAPSGETVNLFPCSMSDGSACNPDGVSFGSMPDGATGDVAGPISWTPTAPGTFEFTYALSDSVTGASSDFVTGTIEVTEDAADAVLSDHAWSLLLGQTITIEAADLAAGCEYHNAFTAEPTGVSCVSTVVGSLDLVTSPDGAAVTTFIDGGGEARFEALSFTPTAVGTFEVTYRAHYGKGWTNVGIGTITVTTPPVAPPVEAPKPVVTG